MSVTAFVLGITALVAAPGASAAPARFEKVLQLSPSADGRLHPVSVTCDPVRGEICVTEDANSSLRVFNSHGIEVFRTDRFADLTLPLDGVVDGQGRLVTLTLREGRRNTIARLNIYGEPDGYAPRSPVADWNPSHLLLMRDGDYLTLDSASGLLVKHDARTGAVLWQRTIAGLGQDAVVEDKNLGRPAESADGRIIVPGGNLHVVLVLDARGETLDVFGRFGSAPGRMVFPVAAAFGADGELYVLDRMRHKILAFDADFGFVGEFGSLGSVPGTFYHPLSLADDGRGRLYVAQGYKGRVQAFDVSGDGAVE